MSLEYFWIGSPLSGILIIATHPLLTPFVSAALYQAADSMSLALKMWGPPFISVVGKIIREILWFLN